MSVSIWEELAGIDCNAHIEKKGKFSYLAWTWAWAMVKERYPSARYQLMDDIIYPDGTMEVRVEVTILSEDNAPLSNTMWLPVLNFQNSAIANPNAFDINSARMRCLVKCLAMFGLGHYIFAGESAPTVPAFTSDQKAEFIKLVADNDGFGLKKFSDDVGNDIVSALFNDAPHGQKVALKDKVRASVVSANASLKTALGAIQAAINDGDYSAIEEVYGEMGVIERGFVDAGLSEIQVHQIDQLRAG